MITKFIQLGMRFLFVNKFRVIFSIIGVILSLTLLISVNYLIKEMEYSSNENIREQFGTTDIRAGVSDVVDENGERVYLDKEEIVEVKKIKGIKNISNVLLPDQLNINDVSSIYTIGVDNNDLVKSMYKYKSDIKQNDIVINRNLADILKVNKNSKISVRNNKNEIKEFRILEIIDDKKGLINVNRILINIETAQKWLDLKGKGTLLLIEKYKDTGNELIENELLKIDSNLRIEFIEKNDLVVKNLKQVKTIGYGLSIIVILLSILFIMSNFNLFIRKYKRDLAIIRSCGGRQVQSFLLVLWQAIFIVIIGIVLSIIISYFICTSFSKFIISMFGMENISFGFQWIESIKVALLGGISILGFLLFPAIKSSKILPLKLLNESISFDFKKSKFRKIIVIILAIIGCILIFSGYLSNASNIDEILIGGFLGSLLIVSSLLIGFTLYIKKLFEFLMPFVKKVGGTVSFVAVKNIIAHTKRNSLIIITLSSSIIIMFIGTTILDVVVNNGEKYIRETYVTDFVLETSKDIDLKKDFDFVKSIKHIKGIKEVAIFTCQGNLRLNKSNDSTNIAYSIIDFKELDKMRYLDINGLNDNNYVILTRDLAQKLKIKDNETITLIEDYYKNGVTRMENKMTFRTKIIDKYDSNLKMLPNDGVVIDISNIDKLVESEFFSEALINVKNGDKNEVIAGLNTMKDKYTGISWLSLDEALDYSVQLAKQRYSLLYVTILLILLLGIIGSTIILSSYIHAQRREYAILRAIYITQNQLIKVIITQSILYNISAVILGNFCGLLIWSVFSIGSGKIVEINWINVILISLVIVITSIILSLPVAKKIKKKEIISELQYIDR